MKRVLFSLFLLFLSIVGMGQTPEEFLGYPLGTRFTPHHQVAAYFKEVASAHSHIKLENYGKTYEGRPLLMAIISSKENMERLEAIRIHNLEMARTGKKPDAQWPAILWLSYNVHGNEASSTETAMKVLHILASAKDDLVSAWLKNTVVIIDPCLNPDGRERYVQFYQSVSGKSPNPDPTAREHEEPWPGGRTNHYYFDLNRDWAWQSQQETQQRLKAYHDWLPQVHVDFHEQNYNDPYYFAPAAEPIHREVTSWQRDFQVTVGKNNARYFDEKGWAYFTKERFDLLYPSYGDTYPLYNGSIGMTYEQGGIRAGLAVITANGDTLTLRDRIDHHLTTSIATLETTSLHAGRLLSEFASYFHQSIHQPSSAYKSYVIKGQNLSRIHQLASLLEKNKIQFRYGGDRQSNGFNYETLRNENFRLERNDLIIPLNQSKSVLINVLFEPETFVSDSNTYDITAWALPYAYGLKAYATKEALHGQYDEVEDPALSIPAITNPYAWVLKWEGMEDTRLLIALQQQQVKVRYAEEAFSSSGRQYPVGSLLVYRAENERLFSANPQFLMQLANRYRRKPIPLASGFVDRGKDLGSSVYPLLTPPKVAVLSGPETSSQNLGEIWHFFEQELNYPLLQVSSQQLAHLNNQKINTLIIPDGRYTERLVEQVSTWISNGGKLILIEDAFQPFVGKKNFHLKKKEHSPSAHAGSLKKFSEKDSDDLSNAIPGAIYKVHLDKSHPLTLALGDHYYTLKTDAQIYEPMSEGYNAGLLKADSYISGIAGSEIRKKLQSGMLFGTQSFGRGQVVYLGTNPLFRSFWQNGKQLFTNALFMSH